jgi:hypothetical protein
MKRKYKFVVGHIVQRSTTLVMLQQTASPIEGPWLLQAVVKTG